ncbi:MAG: hypothetical protein ABTS16_15310 [Candidatus Accumulibacter phosphatis]|uniref:LysR family transcriptional regulator n=1 Tax=Candidatus Accumulibacter contiguus TaxID=2954381 RepID=A0ABX1TD05_9PROT|nr:hypothetical protein [Candidatus Accumulibacter contiguus]NMQ06826.1 hypothetical protein [Candidatus Accumulibacter contiguus]
MDSLVRLVARKPASKSEAAMFLGVDRASIDRLLNRIDEVVGDTGLSWNEGHRLVFPAEVKRLAEAIRRNDDEIAAAIRFPRVSAGSLSAMLVRQVFARLDYTPRALLLRSTAAVDALRDGDIDLAIVHRGSATTIDEDIAMVSLAPWRAVIAAPRGTSARVLSTLTWESGGYGEKLNHRVALVEPEVMTPHGPLATSYLSALEMVRRGLPYRLVLPDIYLSKFDWEYLSVNRPARDVVDELVALHRKVDERRLGGVLEPDLWKEVVKA